MEIRTRVPSPLEVALKGLTNEEISKPLWNWSPDVRPAIQHERRVRRLELDPEPQGDAEFE